MEDMEDMEDMDGMEGAGTAAVGGTVGDGMEAGGMEGVGGPDMAGEVVIPIGVVIHTPTSAGAATITVVVIGAVVTGVGGMAAVIGANRSRL
jgi:hypothetical protein